MYQLGFCVTPVEGKIGRKIAFPTEHNVEMEKLEWDFSWNIECIHWNNIYTYIISISQRVTYQLDPNYAEYEQMRLIYFFDSAKSTTDSLQDHANPKVVLFTTNESLSNYTQL